VVRSGSERSPARRQGRFTRKVPVPVRHVGTSNPATRPPAGVGLLAALSGVAVATEVVAGYAAVGTFTLSTVPEDRASAAAHYSIMLACAAVFLLLAIGYWFAARARVAAVLMAVTGALTALGLWTWLLTPALVVTAVVVSFVRRNVGVRTPPEQHGPAHGIWVVSGGRRTFGRSRMVRNRMCVVWLGRRRSARPCRLLAHAHARALRRWMPSGTASRASRPASSERVAAAAIHARRAASPTWPMDRPARRREHRRPAGLARTRDPV
jgi:hypothetical protein